MITPKRLPSYTFKASDNFIEEKIYVCCPKCKNLAIVKAKKTSHINSHREAKVRCTKCSYSKSYEQNKDEWYGYVTSHLKYDKCPICGVNFNLKVERYIKPISHSVMGFLSKPLMTKLYYPGMSLFSRGNFYCHSCAKKVDVEVIWWRSIIGHKYGYDEYFGLWLYLTIPCLGKKIWVRNPQELDLFRKFISQQKEPSKELFSRYPAWVKNKKNKKNILSCLDKLKKKLNQKP